MKDEEEDITEDLNEVADSSNSDHSSPPPLMETESPVSGETVSSVPPPLTISPISRP